MAKKIGEKNVPKKDGKETKQTATTNSGSKK